MTQNALVFPAEASPGHEPQEAQQGEEGRSYGTCGALVTPKGGVVPVRCANPVLPPRKVGCSDAHKTRLWDAAHPRDGRSRLKLTDPEIREAILKVLSDGQEHEIRDFVAATGATWARIAPRLRDLRKKPFGSHNVPRGRLIGERDGTPVYVYRLGPKPEETK
jgi:hypothetical protein